MLRVHKIKLNPTEAQASYFAQCAGVARYTWNWALARWKAIKATGAEASFNAIKSEFRADVDGQHPFFKDVASCVIDEAIGDLSRAISTYHKSKQTYLESGNATAVARLKFPKWRKRREGQGGFAYTNTRFKVDGHSLKLSRGGVVNMAEELRFTGKLMSCRIVQEAGEWFAAISVEAEAPAPSTGKGVIGVHFGLRHFATMSDGQQIESPRAYIAAQDRLARAQRHLSRKQKGSARYRKQRAKVARIHQHIANQREHFQHGLTTALVRKNAVIVYDKWDIQGLIDLPDQRWAKGFYDAAIGETVRQLEYKGKMYSVTVHGAKIKASKTCHKCGAVNEGLTLVEKTWNCPNCGAMHDRERNAAMNNYLIGVALSAGTNQVGVTPVEPGASDSDSDQD
jgi:putative transposase